MSATPLRPGALLVPALLVLLAVPPRLGAAPAAGAGETTAPATSQDVEREEEETPPPFADPVGGFDVSILGGTQFAVSNSGQVGGAIAYFFEPAARYGIEIEGTVTLGSGGRLVHGLASLVLQAGARTSRYVPYVALGGGIVRAEVDLQREVEDLSAFDLTPPATSESAPMVAVGGGLRYYLKEGVSVRADYREFLVFLDDADSTRFSLRRFGGMLSFEF